MYTWTAVLSGSITFLGLASWHNQKYLSFLLLIYFITFSWWLAKKGNLLSLNQKKVTTYLDGKENEIPFQNSNLILKVLLVVLLSFVRVKSKVPNLNHKEACHLPVIMWVHNTFFIWSPSLSTPWIGILLQWGQLPLTQMRGL